ncbi:MAG: methionyl-tRNA formyltransferase, partial [Actinomycetes bacterium]
MRLVFAGTPAVAVISLRALLSSTHEVVGVLTRPDAPAGRGRRLTPSPVAELARAEGIDTLTPRRVGEADVLSWLRARRPDVAPVVAYGSLIPPAALVVPRYGWVNLHFSLLPAWRGAGPVPHAIAAGDEVTGVTTFALDAGMDTGGVYGTVAEAIRPADTAGDLLTRLAASGSRLLLATLDGIQDGTVVPVPQSSEGVSHAPKVSVDDARVDWSAPALAVERRVRAYTPDPGAWTTVGD